MKTNPTPTNLQREKKASLAVFPGYLFGYSVGWLNGDKTWCFVWGNFKTREQANEVLKREYPENEIINYDKENQPHSRDNPGENL